MQHEVLEEIVYGRISDLVDQMSYHQNANDFIMVAILHDEIKQLTSHMKDDDYDFFYSTDHKYLDWTMNNQPLATNEDLEYFGFTVHEPSDDEYYECNLTNRYQCPEGCNLDYYDQQEDY